MAEEKKPGIPVVIMTEYASYPDAVKAIKMGAQDYLPKPVHRERLFEVVKELVHPALPYNIRLNVFSGVTARRRVRRCIWRSLSHQPIYRS